MSTANRGKKAEGIFHKWATSRSDSQANFCFHRYPDRRSGSFSPVPADFEAVQGAMHFLVEVKEVEHAYRLPFKNFTPDKVARARKFQLAGSQAYVLILSTSTGKWRVITVEWLFENKGEGGSWDLRSFPEKTFNEAVSEIFD